MTLYSYLETNYGYNKPIIVSELKEKDELKNKNLKQLLYTLEKKDKISRYSQGVYYLPTETIFGKSTLNIDEIIYKKYISNGEEIYGFYTGFTFLNSIGLSEQIVAIPNIVTNNTSSKKRFVFYKKRRTALLNKSKVTINKDNFKILQFLDVFRFISDSYIEEIKKGLIKYIKREKLSRKDVEDYIKYFPKSTMDKLIRSGLIYEFTLKKRRI